MQTTRKNLLLTGLPGVGKTTLIRKLYEALKPLHPVGFYTAEIRERGIRKGFELATLDGKRSILSHVDIKSPFKVGKYGVDVDGFERLLDTIDFFHRETKLIVIDEIGKMECFSEMFKSFIKDILSSNAILIATIALKGSGFIVEVKQRPDITLFEMTPRNRDTLLSEIVEHIRKLKASYHFLFVI